ncbi:hypothetical protein ABLG96_03820 [Nakamurella sp. A5-74]|uniref:Uncharacterized protein n=1 Tax=Nakamurella sp. A5-74 TaxID=3158264 RepID=A0AAU8DSN1_9ACTN
MTLTLDHEPTAWLRAQLQGIDDAQPGCRHIRTGRGVKLPAVFALWQPGFVTCHPCAAALLPATGSASDRTCDRCHRQCIPALGDPIHPAATQVGAILVLLGLCRQCLRREVPQ